MVLALDQREIRLALVAAAAVAVAFSTLEPWAVRKTVLSAVIFVLRSLWWQSGAVQSHSNFQEARAEMVATGLAFTMPGNFNSPFPRFTVIRPATVATVVALVPAAEPAKVAAGVVFITLAS